MKKLIMIGLTGACAAGLVMAEDSAPWYKKLFGKSGDDQTNAVVESVQEISAPAATTEMPRMPRREGLSEEQRQKLTPEQLEKLKARREQMMKQREGENPVADKQHQKMNPQQMEKMKAQREAIMKLGEAARNEKDPVKKEALIAELRTKLAEASDRIQEEAKKRLAQIGKETKALEKRIADYDKNKSARIEEQVQRILAGEPLRGSDGKRPSGGPKKDGKKPKAPVEE